MGTRILIEVIARVRRRLLVNAFATQSARAFNAAMAMLVLAGIFGTELLNWPFLIAPPVLTLALGVFLCWRTFPSLYTTAQIIDMRLGLADALSTALFFQSAPLRRCDEEIRRAQIEMASRAAAGVKVRDAAPFCLPRAAYASVVLTLAACGLLAVRYRIVGRLDLRPPIVPTVQQLLVDARQELSAIRHFFESPRPRRDPEQMTERRQQEPMQSQSHETSTSNNQQVSAAPQQSSAELRKTSNDDQMATDDNNQSTGDSNGDEASEQDARQSSTNNPSRRASQPNAPSKSSNDGPDSETEQNNQSGDSPGMLSRLSNTVSNLLSVFKPQPGGRGQQTADMNRNGKPQTGRGNGKSASGQQNGDPSASPGGDQQDGAQREGQDGSSGGRSLDGESGKQPGSGAGKDDGDKNVRLAEQRQAMGKISVILGKRSENLTGSTAIEVVSGRQELSTRYEQHRSAHTDVHAKAARDEVPLEYQNYVKQYFKQIRESSPRNRLTVSK